jgi:hypothetical protein
MPKDAAAPVEEKADCAADRQANVLAQPGRSTVLLRWALISALLPAPFFRKPLRLLQDQPDRVLLLVRRIFVTP